MALERSCERLQFCQEIPPLGTCWLVFPFSIHLVLTLMMPRVRQLVGAHRTGEERVRASSSSGDIELKVFI